MAVTSPPGVMTPRAVACSPVNPARRLLSWHPPRERGQPNDPGKTTAPLRIVRPGDAGRRAAAPGPRDRRQLDARPDLPAPRGRAPPAHRPARLDRVRPGPPGFRGAEAADAGLGPAPRGH